MACGVDLNSLRWVLSVPNGSLGRIKPFIIVQLQVMFIVCFEWVEFVGLDEPDLFS